MLPKILFSALTLAIVLFAGILPKLYLNAVPATEYVKPRYEQLSEKLHCTGVVEAVNTAEIYLSTPVIAKNINVTVGDYIDANALMATVDTELTKSVLTGGEAVNGAMPMDFKLSDLSQLEEIYSMAQMAGVDINGLIDAYTSTGYSTAPKETALYITEEITSPIAGIVSEVNIRTNMLCGNQKPIFTVVDTSKYKVTAQVGQSDVEKIAVGDKAYVTFNASKYDAVISKIYPIAKKSTGALSTEAVIGIELTLENPDERVKAGYNVDVEIRLGEETNSVMLPFETVMQDERNQEYIYVLNGSQAVRRDITTGAETADGVEVTAGLEMEDIVIYKPEDIATIQGTVYIKGEALLD